MKVIIAVSIVVFALLFFKRYDLYESRNDFDNSYVVVEEGILLERSCISKGKTLDNPFKCVGHNLWGKFLKNNHDYNKEREID